MDKSRGSPLADPVLSMAENERKVPPNPEFVPDAQQANAAWTVSAGEASVFGRGKPLGRPGQPAETAPIHMPLASNAASCVPSQIDGCTGGGLLA